MQFKKLTLSVIAASALIFGPAAIEATTSIELGAAAHAKGGNGGGTGNGGGNGNSSKNSSAGGGNSLSSTSSGSVEAEGGNAYGKSKEKSLGNDRGSLASKLGALNAAHASANARLHASENSRVGMIAAYETAVLAGVQLSEDYEEAGNLLESILSARAETLPDGYDSIDAVITELSSLRDREDELKEQLSALETNGLTEEEFSDLLSEYSIILVEGDGVTAISTEDLSEDLALALNSELGSTTIKIDTLAAAATEYEGFEDQVTDAEAAIADLEEQNDAQAQIEVDALAAAANKSLSSEVVDEVNRLLGIESAYSEPVDELLNPTPDAS